MSVLPLPALQREILPTAVGNVVDAAAVPAAGGGFAGAVAQKHKRQMPIGNDAEGDGAFKAAGGSALTLKGKRKLRAAKLGCLPRGRGVDDIQPVIAGDGKSCLPCH